MPMITLPGTVSRPAETIVRQIDLISAVDSLAKLFTGRILLTIVQLGGRVLQNVSSDARLICTVVDSALEIGQEIRQILITAHSEFLSRRVLSSPKSKQWNVILPVVASRSEVGNLALNVSDFVEKLRVDVAIDAEAVVQSQRSVERKSGKVGRWVKVLASVLAIVKKFLDADERFEVENWHVRLNSRAVEGSGGGLPAVLAGLIPW